MAPAPKARYQRRSSHGARSLVDGEGKSSEDTKIGEDENGDDRMKRHVSYTESGETHDRSDSPRTSLLMRRSSTGIDGRMENVPVRANFDDIKQHLKHLGPSNRASNPKATRSTTVKIKPGIPHEQPRASSAAEEAIPEEGDERTSLLKGVLAPKDGVHALATSYGATGVTALSRSPDASNLSVKNIDTTRLEDQATQTSAHPSTTDLPATAEPSAPVERELRSKKSGSGKSTSGKSASGSEGDFLDSSGPYSHRKSLFARSGSITEQVVETRGIKKTILETTSSNEEEEENFRTPRLATRSTPSLPAMGEAVLSPIESPGHEDSQASTPLLGGNEAAASAGDDDGHVGEGAASNQNGGGDNGNGGGKKKNRRKKRKGKS